MTVIKYYIETNFVLLCHDSRSQIYINILLNAFFTFLISEASLMCPNCYTRSGTIYEKFSMIGNPK